MSTITREITVETDSGKQVTLEVEVSGYFEPNYGSDYDGNRGIPVWFIDEAEFDIPDQDDNGVVLTDEEKEEVESLINSKIDDDSWEFEENVDPYDDDDVDDE